MPSNGSHSPDIRAVVFDWRGTLVTELSPTRWMQEALRRVGRPQDDAAALALLQRIQAADGHPSRLRSPQGNTSAARHEETYRAVFADAGLDTELSDELFAVDSDPTYNHFAADAAATLTALAEYGCKIGILSNIHFDIRPCFAEAQLFDLIDTFVLSSERGIQKPDPAIFRATLDELGTHATETLMVGDRPSRDGMAVEVGMPTLLVPSLTDPQRCQLHVVVNAIGASRTTVASRRMPP
ncbi:HAD family hydrolase [Nocardia bhagyanarayanae]|uniref:HAD superfamily hydrolase (TIGR01549 family) n=1 Tax=Nocardia bhagyanarayanae TaxID=1215925 RepID=A0A543F8K7_9NOCA|nr:HAD family hydrolase [Nocardia bhagyanarayanae]TQM30166.1 HAD superfamily hydrolase (TIGR01549 family) [Nocardia bhagyanarayanae]